LNNKIKVLEDNIKILKDEKKRNKDNIDLNPQSQYFFSKIIK
jgi:hypothetical protein